jgi:hypothetical protein
MASDTPTLRANCRHCRGNVTLQFEDWDPDHLHHSRRTQYWLCPYCDRTNDGRFPGRLVWVVKELHERAIRPT